MKAVRCGFTVFHQDVGLNPACLTSLIARWPCKVWPSLPLSSVLCCTCISYLSPPFKSDHCAFWNIHYLSMMFASDSQPLVWAFLEPPLLIKPSCLLRAVFSPWLSRNCWVDCFGIQRLEWWSSSLLKITGKPFLFHIFIENPRSFKILALWQCFIYPSSSFLPMTVVLNSHDSLRASTPGSQLYLSLTLVIIWGDFNASFGDLSDTFTISYLGPSSPWIFSASAKWNHYHWSEHVILWNLKLLVKGPQFWFEPCNFPACLFN